MTTHTQLTQTRRFNRHNLPPNHGAVLAVLNEARQIRCVVAAALRVTTNPQDPEKFDQIFFAQPQDDAAVLESRPVTADAHRTTVIFTDTACTRKIGKLKDGDIWAQISIRGCAPNQLRPEIVWTELDENNWLSTGKTIATDTECWPLDARCVAVAEKNPVAWHVATHAAVIIGGMKFISFPSIEATVPQDLNWLMERDVLLRAQRATWRTQKLLEKLPDHLRASLIAKLAASDAPAEVK